MGKIGDIFVRLGLKKDGYTKGMNEAKKENNGFISSLGKMKAGALAVWAAVGTAVVGFAKEVIDGSNRIGDAWNRTTAQMKAGWDVFIQSVSNWNWDNFIGRIRESAVAAKELTQTMDGLYEMTNSVDLQEAMQSDRLAQLQIDMRDRNKSGDERLAAVDEYEKIVKGLYDQRADYYRGESAAQVTNWIAGTSLAEPLKGLEKDSAEYKAALDKVIDNFSTFIIEYSNKNKELTKVVGTVLGGEPEAPEMPFFTTEKNLEAHKIAMKEWQKQRDEYYAALETLGKISEDFGFNVLDFAKVYENYSGDSSVQPVIDSLKNLYNSQSAYKRENRRVETTRNSINAEISGELAAESTALAEALGTDADAIIASADKLQEAWRKMAEPLPEMEGVSGFSVAEMPDIVPDDWLERNREKIDQVIAEKDRLMQAGQMLSDALTYGTTNALDEFANALAGVEGSDAGSVVKALLSPLADAAVQAGMLILTTGTALESLQTALTNLFGGGAAGAIAAGTALIAVGVAAKAGLAAIGSGGASSAATGTATSYNSSGYGSYRPTVESQELTVYVKGIISGSDIVLAADRTKKKWDR